MNSLIGILNDITSILLAVSLRTAVLIVFIFLVKYLLRKKLNTKFHYAIWCLVLLSLMIPQAPQSSMSIYNIPKYFEQNHTGAQNTTLIEDNDKQGTIFSSGLANIEFGENSDFQDEKNNLNIFFYTWVAGVVLMGGYISYKSLSLNRLIKNGDEVVDEAKLNCLEKCKKRMKIKKDVKILGSNFLNVPVLYGISNPKIVLPSEILLRFNNKQLEYIILHELSHLKRKDLYMSRIILIFQVIHWFNPLVWIAFNEMRNDMELECDVLVLRHIKKEEHIFYGKVILDFLEYLSKPRFIHLTTNLLENKREVKRRIIMIKNFKKNSLILTLVGFAIIGLVGCSAISSPTVDEKADTKAEEKAENAPEKSLEISLPPKELIESNVEDTDVSVAVKVMDASRVEQDDKENVYVTYKINAEVINSYKGKYEVGDGLEFYKTVEYNEKYDDNVPFINQKMIVSFIYGEDEQLQIPDVAYGFMYSEDLNSLYESVSEK